MLTVLCLALCAVCSTCIPRAVCRTTIIVDSLLSLHSAAAYSHARTCSTSPQTVKSNFLYTSGRSYNSECIPTNYPAICLIIKQKYCLSHQNITKSLFFVLTCDALCPYIVNGHAAFSSKNTLNQTNLTHFSSKALSAGW